MWLFLLSRQNNSQVWSINGSINRLYLEVNISNTPTQGQPAEDAHNSLLNISIPTMFIFSGVRTKVLKVGRAINPAGKVKVSPSTLPNITSHWQNPPFTQ